MRESCTKQLYSTALLRTSWRGRGENQEERMERKGGPDWKRKKKDSRSLGQSSSYCLIMDPSPRMHKLMYPSHSEKQRFLTPRMLFFCG